MRKAVPFVIVAALVAMVGLISYTGPAPAPAADQSVQDQEAVAAADAVDLVPDATSLQRAPFPVPTTCGGNVCSPGQYCCNPSCGTCVRLGNYCTQQVCSPTS